MENQVDLLLHLSLSLEVVAGGQVYSQTWKYQMDDRNLDTVSFHPLKKSVL